MSHILVFIAILYAQTVAEWNAETYGGTVAHWEAFLAQQAAK
jgi:hypothetical protein